MNKIFKSFKLYYVVIAVCFILFILHKNKKWSNGTDSWNNICSDGRGYYAWLPATFIYHDLNFGFFYTVEKDEVFMPNKGCYQNYINTFNGRNTNKYYPGTALCMLPFFKLAHFYCKITGTYVPNGYTTPYFIAIGIAALFWFYLGLFFLWRTMALLNISNLVKTLTCLIVILGSNAIFFSVDAPSYSHIYSFSLISIFVWLAISYKKTFAVKYLLLMAFFIGWIFISRPVNISILIFLPFMFYYDVATIFKKLCSKPINIILFISLGLLLPIVLFTMYKISTGSFFVYSYGNEGFDFIHPHIWDFLTSYDNGVIKYVPALMIPFLFIYWGINVENKKIVLGLIICILTTVYIHASWWCWSYGGSFGPRTLLDFMSVFGVLIAYSLSTTNKKILYLQYFSFLLCVVFTSVLYHFKTHGYMFESPITSNEYYRVFNNIF